MDFQTELKTYADDAVRLMLGRVKDAAAKALAEDFLAYIARYNPPASAKSGHSGAGAGKTFPVNRDRKILLFLKNKEIGL